jgi:uncharacterized membrane protein
MYTETDEPNGAGGSFGLPSWFFLLVAAGMILVFAGGLLVLAATATGGGGGSSVSTGIVIFIGPFPIVFGAGPDAGCLSC